MRRREASAQVVEKARGTFVLVGHCMPDEFMLTTAIRRVVQGARIERVNDFRRLAMHLHDGAVLLVNRVLEGRFDSTDGIELIGQVASAGSGDKAPVCLLISNYADAQERAVALGARPGFGKRDLYGAETGEVLRDAAGVAGIG